MSITEEQAGHLAEPPFDDWGDGPVSYAPGERPQRPGDRTPPQDMAAEQSVLGSMLISKDACAEVSEVLRGTDFVTLDVDGRIQQIVGFFGEPSALQ